MIADLHTHSTASDGQYTPSELAELVKKRGAEAWALTDHDNVDGVEEAKTAGKALGLQVIQGVELSADGGGGVAAAESGELAGILARGRRVLFDRMGISDVLCTAPGQDPEKLMFQEEFINTVNDFWFHTVWAAKKLRRGGALCSCDQHQRLSLPPAAAHDRAL